MKTLHLVCLACALLASGCANLDNTSPQTQPAGASSAPAPGAQAPRAHSRPVKPPAAPVATHLPVYPGDPLLPITETSTASAGVAALLAPADLWERIRRGFAMPDLQHPLVGEREQWYAARPDYMQRMTERSAKYLFHVVEELERRGMPSELALLPYIESAFNPQATSSAKAAGIWQFMPATGSDFDLKQNAFRDDRRDVLASTRAALDYLQKLYALFGDWHLALAAYNWGEGSVGRAIARNQKKGLGSGYTDLDMPAETRLYVPKLQAVKNIVANPEAFGTELPLIENHPYFQTVEITHDIDVALVAELAAIREADFRALNPSFKRPVILAAGTPQILLPWDNAKLFRHNLQARSRGQYASWTVWSVPATMSVSEAAQRVGLSEAELRSVNDIPPRMRIKAGSALMVPRSTRHQDVSPQLADNGQMALMPEISTRRTTLRAGRGETVASIARRYKLTAASVAGWNQVRSNAAFKAGQQVIVYLPVRAPAARSASRSAKRKPALVRRGGSASKQARGD